MSRAVTVQHVPVHDVRPRPVLWSQWERRRNRQFHWVAECIAESLGTFLFTWAGAGSSAAYILGNILEIPGLGSVFQTGIAYAVGITLALAVCQATSEGTFNIGISIHAMVFKGFPIKRGIRHIVAQIIGAYIACLLIYVQWRQYTLDAIAILKANGSYDTVMFTPSGPGGIFGLYAPTGSNLGFVVVNEFVSDFVVAIVIFACTMPSNHISTPTTAPWIIALAYAVVIWSFGPIGLSANASRDIGGRIAALTLFGEAASGGRYAAIAALTNIPATLLAGVFFELVINDSTRSVNPEWVQAISAQEAERVRKANGDDSSYSLRSASRSDEKIGEAKA